MIQQFIISFLRHPCHPNPINIFTKVSPLDLSVSEYQISNICNFATTYYGRTAEKVCPTYPPIYCYSATPPLQCNERKYVTNFQTRTRNPGLTFHKPKNPGLQKEPRFENSNPTQWWWVGETSVAKSGNI